MLATLDASGNPTYRHPDHLSARLFTNNSGTVVGTYGHLPFGELWYSTGTVDKWKFTSYERDTDTSLDYAMMRFDSARLARFATPDPYAGSMAAGNPQSWNRYAYVTGDPLNFVDPLGLIKQVPKPKPDGGCTWNDSNNELTCPNPYASLAGFCNVANGASVRLPFACDTSFMGVFITLEGLDDTHPRLKRRAADDKAADNTAQHKDCPSAIQSQVNNALLNLVLGPMMGAQSIPQLGRGGVVGIGLGAAGATSGLGWHLGLAGSVSVGLLFDSHGNIGLAISPSGGRGEGAGWTAGGQFTTAPFANTIWDLGGPSGSVGGGGGAGLAGAVEVSSNGGGAVTETIGIGAGGFGMTFLGGPTVIVPLVCK